MNVSRLLAAYEVLGDALIKEIMIPLSVDTLRGILNAKEDDANLLEIYEIDKIQFAELAKRIPELAEHAFEPYDWFYECYSNPG